MKKIGIITLLVFLSAKFFAQGEMTLSYKIYEPDCELGAVKINVEGGVPPYNFMWSNGALGDTISSLNGGHYTVHVTDSDPQSADQDISFDVVAFNCKIAASDKFSPNGDGINDTWTISRTDMFPHFLLLVYDRWGQLVHSQRRQYTAWDGTQLGIKVSEATYYYIFYYEEGKSKEIEKGTVTIVR